MRLQKENAFLTETDPGKIKELKLGGYVEVPETEGLPSKEDLREEIDEQQLIPEGTSKAALAEKLQDGRQPGEGLPGDNARVEEAQAATEEVNEAVAEETKATKRSKK